MRKSVSLALAVLLSLTAVLPGCSKGTSKVTTSSDATSSGVPAFKDIKFPDVLPTTVQKGDSSKYSYDDMTKKYTVSILTTNNGVASPTEANDPICQWLEKKFNLAIKFETCSSTDLPNIVSTRFAGGDAPDIFKSPDQSTATTLYEQQQLVDARKIYPYMPLCSKYTTKNMIKALTDTDGGLPCITHYAFQDGVWGFAVRKDWLKKFNMKEPTTEAEVLAYAKACCDDDPDGNGKKDTFFMIGGNAGKAVTAGMMGGWQYMFGNPSTHVDGGKLSDPIFNGQRQKVLTFINKLYTNGYLQPDWYTIEWEKTKSYTHNDKVGMVYYPVADMVGEEMKAKNNDPAAADIWEWYKQAPIEGGKYQATGALGQLYCFTKSGFTDNGKLMRVAHMIDTMLVGGENFFNTCQGGSDDTFAAAGVKVETHRTWKYNDTGTFTLTTDSTGAPWNNNNLIVSLTGWQNIGWGAAYSRNDTTVGTDLDKKLATVKNTYADVVASYDRWPNDDLLSAVANETLAPGITDWVNSEELKFVTGKRSFNEWNSYEKEWLAKGGKAIIAAKAKKLDVDVPDYAK